ncbi:hypothetical protein AB0G87_23975 [Streptomyces asoensis]|uniref:hypothetical protein n=1 Tax=Streptomyces asoensis TaxID=249586 RepID=UPI0033F01304
MESVHTSELLGRPVAKAWNAALAGTRQAKGVPAGTPGHLAVPVAGDSDEAKRVAMRLVDEIDPGTISRQATAGHGGPRRERAFGA